MAEINYVGELILGDMHAMLGRQIQPAYAETDILYTLGPQNMLSVDGIAFDKHHDCICLESRFVPFNQNLVNPNVRDKGVFQRSALPTVRWDNLSITGAQGANTATLQEFPDSHWGFAYWAATVKKDEDAATARLSCRAEWFQVPGGPTKNFMEREVTLYYSHHLFSQTSASGRSQIYISLKIGGFWYRVRVDALVPPAVDHSSDGGITFTQLKEHVKPGSSSAHVSGATGSNRLGEMVEVRCRVMNGRLSISVGGSGAVPYVVPLAKYTRWGILACDGTSTITLPAGSTQNLPPAPFYAHVWRGGVGTASNKAKIQVTAVNMVTDTLTVTGTLTGIGAGSQFDILDPRIESVRVDVLGFSQFACSVHPTRWRSTGNYVRAPFQSGFVPLAATIAGFQYHTDGEVGAALNNTAWHPTLLTGASVLGELNISGSVAQYRLTLTGTDKNDAATGAFSSWQGEPYADDTPVLTRVTTRFQGIEGTPSYTPNTILLGVGGTNPVRSITQEIHFDPAALTISNQVSVTLDNWHGLGYLQGTTGVGAFGNVAVGLRLGHLHQQPLVTPGRYGFPRFWGFSDSRGFTTSPGGSPSLMTMTCTDQMQQLSECLIAAPPDLDGHNHYWAMAYLAQFAGIPLSRCAFAAYVPDSPYDWTVSDANPYFLPMGAGMHPWTPVNRTVSVLSLMEQIRRVTGYMMYFDVFGMLQYLPFSPALGSTTPLRTFTTVPAPTLTSTDSNGGLTEMWNLQIGTSVRDVRNQTLLIGIDSEHTWGVIGAKLEDSNSIAQAPGSQPINYKGYKSPMVWMDSRFANEGFAMRSASALYNWLRQPTVTVTFDCWPQYDLYALDLINVDDPRTGSVGMPFFIMSMSITTPSHGLPHCTITARYLDPALGYSF